MVLVLQLQMKSASEAKPSKIQPACVSPNGPTTPKKTGSAISAKANRGKKEQHTEKTARGRAPVLEQKSGGSAAEMESNVGMCLPNTLQSPYRNLKA